MTDSLRQYEGLWKKIAEASDDAPVTAVCHRHFAKTLIQAVRKEKSAENTIRKGLEVVAYGKLRASIAEMPGNRDKVRVTFTLTFNGNLI